jgi:hypothetical protein
MLPTDILVMALAVAGLTKRTTMSAGTAPGISGVEHDATSSVSAAPTLVTPRDVGSLIQARHHAPGLSNEGGDDVGS